jgi:radical SAM protein with 4Fe4S-binding SPASM domain
MNNDIYMLNPDYKLKSDKNRVVIMNRYTNTVGVEDFTGFVHPVYAAMLSVFDGEKKYKQVTREISGLLQKDMTAVSKIVTPLLENEEEVHFTFENRHFSFPRQLLVKKTNGVIAPKYNMKEFLIPKKDLDLNSWRLNSPLDILFMVNTLCYTDCVYCYADRRQRMDCQIPLERLKELIKEASDMNMRSFDLSGGELFLYKHWEELLKQFIMNGFKVNISTKIPIGDEIIRKLKELNVNKIQISVDSIVKEELMAMLNVDADYCDRLKQTFRKLDENGMEILTNSQVTSFNENSIHLLIDFLLGLKNIKRINIGVAGYSLYKTEEDYLQYKPRLEQVEKIEAMVNERKAKYGKTPLISFSGYSKESDLIGKKREEKIKSFFDRARCTANFYACVLLPDGKVTICEELYWHPKFIIGDLMIQSIEEVWNSKRALELYHITEDMVSDESACKGCEGFNPCHQYKGVCWKEVLMAYGEDNWDYPDPKCPEAPKPIRQYYLSG